MTGPSSTVTTTTIIAAGLTFQPFGVSMETLVLGGACFFAGSCARTGLLLYRQLDGTGAINYGREWAKLLCTIPLAAVASCIIFFGTKILDMQADTACAGILLVMGVKGPDGFQWIADTLSSVFTKVLPGGAGKGNQP